MKSDVKQRWVDALEGGEYLQAYGCLMDVRGGGDCAFCAIGVLVDLYVREHGNNMWEIDEDDRVGYVQGYYLTLPPMVAEWAGITDDDRYLIEIAESGVVGLNDSDHETFEVIADFIKEKL